MVFGGSDVRCICISEIVMTEFLDTAPEKQCKYLMFVVRS